MIVRVMGPLDKAHTTIDYALGERSSNLVVDGDILDESESILVVEDNSLMCKSYLEEGYYSEGEVSGHWILLVHI